MPKNNREQWTPDRYSKDTKAVLHIALRQVVILAHPPDSEHQHQQIVLAINPSARGMELTYLTEEELDLFKLIITQAIEMARPICQSLDEETAEAFKRNDTRYRRLWRAKPRYVDLTKESHNELQPADDTTVPGRPDNEGTVGEHNQGLPS